MKDLKRQLLEMEQERDEWKGRARRRADVIIEDRDTIEALKARINELENPWQEGGL